jgi:hypothetical protein
MSSRKRSCDFTWDSREHVWASLARLRNISPLNTTST